MSPQCDPGTITAVHVGIDGDHQVPVVTVTVDCDGGIQALQGVFSSEAERDDFAGDMCRTFGVERPEGLVGKSCGALRSWPSLTEAVEGLEAPSGARFTKTRWRRKTEPDAPDPIQRRRASLRRELHQLRRQVAETAMELASVGATYADWEVPVGIPQPTVESLHLGFCLDCELVTGGDARTAEVFEAQYTHAVTPMWKLVGVYDALYSSDGAVGGDLQYALVEGYKTMATRFEECRALNPETGPGDAGAALEFLCRVKGACLRYPAAKVRILR